MELSVNFRSVFAEKRGNLEETANCLLQLSQEWSRRSISATSRFLYFFTVIVFIDTFVIIIQPPPPFALLLKKIQLPLPTLGSLCTLKISWVWFGPSCLGPLERWPSGQSQFIPGQRRPSAGCNTYSRDARAWERAMPKVRFAQSDLIRTKKKLRAHQNRFALFSFLCCWLETWKYWKPWNRARASNEVIQLWKFDDFNPLEENFHLCDWTLFLIICGLAIYLLHGLLNKSSSEVQK